MGEYRFRVGECVRATGKAVAGIVRERKTLIDGNVYKIDWFVDWKEDSQWSWMGEGELAPIELVPDDDAMAFRFNVGDKVWTGSRPEYGTVRLRHRVDTHKVYLVEWDRKSETTLEDEGNLRPVEPELTPEDEFRVGDRVRHQQSGRVGTLGGVKYWDGTTLVQWDGATTKEWVHFRNLTRVEESAPSDPKFKATDRVRRKDRPSDCGVITRSNSPRDGYSSYSYDISWNGSTSWTTEPEEALELAPTSPRINDRVRHNLSGRTGVVRSTSNIAGVTSSMIAWDDKTTPYWVADNDLTPIEEKVEVEPIPKVEMYGRVRDVPSGREGFTLGTLKRDGEWGYLVMWDGQDWSPQWVPERQLVAVEKKKAEEPTMPADPNAGRPTCATCPMMAVVPPTREVSVEASQKYPDANVYQCHALPPARSLVMPWPPTTPDQFCGAHPDFQTWLDARDMARQGERPAREG